MSYIGIILNKAVYRLRYSYRLFPVKLSAVSGFHMTKAAASSACVAQDHKRKRSKTLPSAAANGERKEKISPPSGKLRLVSQGNFWEQRKGA